MARSLPAPRRAIVGRASDLAALRKLIRGGAALITIAATGGAGKTRLATAVGHEHLAEFDNQVYFVALAGLTDPTGVSDAVAGVLQVRASADRSIEDAVIDALRHHRTLLILDNFEQVLDAGPFVSTLLEQCPLLTVLVTSRSPLRVRSEQVFELASLGVDTVEAPGIVLFCDRARAVRPSFELNARNEHHVLELCARLDGLPLAIELAASRISLLSPAALLERFDHSRTDALRLLSGGARDAPTRHRALEDTISWSYELLGTDVQKLLRSLAVFESGCTLTAVEAVCATNTDDAVSLLDGLSALVDLHLIVVESGPESRFRMLETIREFAKIRLVREEPGAIDALRARHSAYYRSLALAAKAGLESKEDGRWLVSLELEYRNLRAALHDTEHRGDVEGYLRITSALGWFWRHTGRGEEGRSRLKDAYERAKPRRIDPSIRADVLLMIGRLSADSGLIGQGRKGADETLTFLEEGLSLHREIGEPVGMMRALESVVTGLVQHENTDQARTLCVEGLALATETQHSWWLAMFLYSLAIIEQKTGDLDAAGHAAKRGRSVALAESDTRLAAIGTLLVGTTDMFAGRFADAERELKVTYHRSLLLGDKRNAAFAAVSLGPVFWMQRILPEAVYWTREGLVLAQAVSEWRCTGFGLTDMTFLSEYAGEHEASARIYGAMRGDFDAFYRALPPRERVRVEHLTQRTRRTLGDQLFELYVGEGEELSRNMAIEYALTVADTILATIAGLPLPTLPVSAAPLSTATEFAFSVVAPTSTNGGGQLSPRERDVLALLASGSSNKQIADQLHISVATVERHLVNTYRKIGVRRRAEATTYAIRHRIISV